MASEFGDAPMGLTSRIMNIAAVLTRKNGLRVPRYQRPYTWTEREVRQLIQDLWRAWDRDAPFYFIGQIVLVRNASGRLEVSDGQQRLATLTMLMAYARDRLPARAKQYQTLIIDGERPQLMLREEDSNFYRGFVQEPGRMSEMARHPEHSVESRQLLCDAARTIEVELRSTEDAKLHAFMSYVARACTLNVVDADERGCAQQVFASLNMRGSQLSGADLLKSDLIENSRLSEGDADRAASQWEAIENMLERDNFERLLDLMPFLLTGEQPVSPGDLASFRHAVEKAGGVYKFLFDQLPRYAQALRAIFTSSIDVGPASADVNRRIKMLKQVEQWDWAPAAIAFLAEHSDKPERARRFFEALDRFTFACELAVIDIRVREKRFAAAVRHCGDDKALYGEGGPLAISGAEFERFIATLARSRKKDRLRRLLLIRVEAAMEGGHILSMTDDVTVEHVLPRAGGAWWNERFPDSKMREELSNLLGNLTLVTHKQNTTADTKPYHDKREIFLNAPGAPVHMLTRDLEQIPEWTLAAIDDRHERLVTTLCQDWGLVRADR